MTTNIIVLYALIFTGLNFIMIIVGRATYKDTNADLNSKGDIHGQGPSLQDGMLYYGY
jgi:hypothetical protein